MRGVQYIRVSDEEQAIEGYSITAQKALLDRKFVEWGATVVGVYIDDGYSAKDLRRPDLQRMLNDLKLLKPDFIAFWKLDRWTRGGSRDWHILQDIIKPLGIKLKSAIGENLNDETAFDRFNVGLNVLLGQFEREQIAERVHFVMTERHLKGLRNGAKPPYGYDLNDGKLFVNEEQAKVVKNIFEMYASGKYGFRAIAVKLNRLSTGRVWNYNSVRYVLMNPVYCGKLRWNYRKASGKPTGKEIIAESDHEPIISEELFEKVSRDIFAHPKGRKAVTSIYAFSSILRCARCGSAMVGCYPSDPYYRCIGRANAGTCDMPTINGKRLEAAFLNALEYDSEAVQKLIDIPDQSEEIQGKRHLLEKELEQIKRRKKKWQIAYADDAISLEEMKERTREDSEREKEISIELANLPSGDPKAWTKDSITNIFSDVRKAFSSASEQEKKMFLRELFSSITVDAKKPDGYPARGRYSTPYIVGFELQSSKEKR